jgi:hypothetical protein
MRDPIPCPHLRGHVCGTTQPLAYAWGEVRDPERMPPQVQAWPWDGGIPLRRVFMTVLSFG